jgi:hypothetical protein
MRVRVDRGHSGDNEDDMLRMRPSFVSVSAARRSITPIA